MIRPDSCGVKDVDMSENSNYKLQNVSEELLSKKNTSYSLVPLTLESKAFLYVVCLIVVTSGGMT